MEKLLRDAGLEDCKPLTTPGVKEPTSSVKAWFEGEDAPHVGDANRVLPIGASSNGSPYLERKEMREYRSAVARCNSLAADRFEIAFTTKELCRAMANPTVTDARSIARLCRFLQGLPRMVQRIPVEDRPPTLIEAYVDSD